jgi:hypothetical protein
MNDNREIFEVPGVYENPRRQTLTLALTVYATPLSALLQFSCLFIMGTLSLEARNIRFVNSNLSRVQESKLIPAS